MHSKIYGIGIDIEDPARFQKYLDKSTKQMPVFSELELKNYNSTARMAYSFCIKEAVFKALKGYRKKQKLNWTDAQIIFLDNSDFNINKISFSGQAEQLIAEEKLNHTPYIKLYKKNNLCVAEVIFFYK